jgi:hypothetical protein
MLPGEEAADPGHDHDSSRNQHIPQATYSIKIQSRSALPSRGGHKFRSGIERRFWQDSKASARCGAPSDTRDSSSSVDEICVIRR